MSTEGENVRRTISSYFVLKYVTFRKMLWLRYTKFRGNSLYFVMNCAFGLIQNMFAVGKLIRVIVEKSA